MNPEIRELFINTISPDEKKRNQCEDKLVSLQTLPNFVLSLPGEYMRDTDPVVKNTSSIYFKNAVISEWSKDYFEQSKKYIIDNLLQYYYHADDINFVAYNGILLHMYNNEKNDVVESFIFKATSLLKSNDIKQINTALLVIEQIFNAGKKKYNLENILEIIYKNSGQEMVTSLHTFVAQPNYEPAMRILKILAKSYNYYTIPEFLCRIDVFSYVINISIEILKLENSNDEIFMKTKKWASFFLYKAANKGVKKFYKKSELSDFITENARFSYIYEVFLNQLKMEGTNNVLSEPIKINSTEFFTLCAADKNTFVQLEKDIIFFITGFILPLYELSADEEDDFEYDYEKFLREKYHYFNYSLRNEAGTLFCEIVKNLKHNNNGMSWLVNFFTQVFESCKMNPSKDNIKKKYGLLFLLSNIVHSIYKFDIVAFEHILTSYVFPEIKDGIPILKSQACYLLSFVEEEITSTQALRDSLKDVIKLIRQNHPILKVDATLSMNFFISNPIVSDEFIAYIPEIVQSILTLSASYDIEPLTFLLDNIMQSYPKEVSNFAPSLVKSLGDLILSHLSSDNGETGDDRLMVISGFLRSVESIVMSIENCGPLVTEVYNNFYNVLFFIFHEKKADFYQEALDIVNGFLYAIKVVEKSMWQIFSMILSFPKDEVLVYPSEIADVIDNYVSFGKYDVLDKTLLDHIYSIIVSLCAPESTFYEDDFIAGAKIIETLLLNVGDKLLEFDPDRLNFFLNMGLINLHKLDDDSTGIIFSLEIVMHCLYLKPVETLTYLLSNHYSKRFFSTVFEKKKLFTRVHDKKICIRFLGRLFTLRHSDLQSLFDLKELNSFFTSILCSLPAAVEARNKLKEAEKDEDYSDEAYDDASNDYNELEEDIYYTTVLDYFDPYAYISNIFSSAPGDSLASYSMRSMTKEQLTSINEVFEKNASALK